MEEQEKQGIEILFCSYGQALALKELGFDEQCITTYDLFGEVSFGFMDWNNSINNEMTPWFVSSPLYQQAFRWFSKKHRIEGWIQPFLSLEPRKFQARYWDGGKTPCEGISIGVYDTYKEAELECLKKLIEIIKNP